MEDSTEIVIIDDTSMLLDPASAIQRPPPPRQHNQALPARPPTAPEVINLTQEEDPSVPSSSHQALNITLNVHEWLPKHCTHYDSYMYTILSSLKETKTRTWEDCFRQSIKRITGNKGGPIAQSKAEAIMSDFYRESIQMVGEKRTDELIALAKNNYWAEILSKQGDIDMLNSDPNPSIEDLLAGKSEAGAKRLQEKYIKSLIPSMEDAPRDDMVDGAGSYSPYIHSILTLFPEEVPVNHPDKLKESTSLASVPLPALPPELLNPSYRRMVDEEHISIAQLEAVLYAKRQFEGPRLPDKEETRAGFFLGDGAGVGKGRTIAALIKDFFDNADGKRVVWVSVSPGLERDAERDLEDVGCSITITPKNKLPSQDKRIDCTKGVLFVTYALLYQGTPKVGVGGPELNNRLNQIIRWLKDCPQGGFIIFDESHKGKNLIPAPPKIPKPTKTGLAMEAMQKQLPNARVLYASATGVTQPRHLGYMIRLSGLGKIDQTIESLGDRLTTMEIASMSLKATGNYISRMLSYEGADFRLVDIKMAKDIELQYDNATKFWVGFYGVMKILMRFIESYQNEDKSPEGKGKEKKKDTLVESENKKKKQKKKTKSEKWAMKMEKTFWEAHQRCFKSILVASKISKAVNIANDEIRVGGHCVVFGIQSTGEASTEQAAEETQTTGHKISDYVSQPAQIIKLCVTSLLKLPPWIKPHDPALKPVLERMIADCEALNSSLDSTLPTSFSQSVSVSDRKLKRPLSFKSKESGQNISKKQASRSSIWEEGEIEEGEIEEGEPSGSRPAVQGSQEDAVESLASCRKKLDAIIDGMDLPPNPLDQLKGELIEKGHQVAELTGRKDEVTKDSQGNVMLGRRGKHAKANITKLNLKERKMFMDGEKLVAIISDACSTGISLQADRRCRNIRRRVHITLELPWSADKTIQQLGRTHRANQTQPPIYTMLLNKHEVRFASAVATQLKRMGAILHADRTTLGAAQQLSQYQLVGEDANEAIALVLKYIFKVDDSDKKLRVYNVKVPDESDLDRLKTKLKEVGIDGCDTKSFPAKRFYSRLLGIDISSQQELYTFFYNTFDAVARKKRDTAGNSMAGIVTISGQNVQVKEREVIKRVLGGDISGVRVELDRGVSWDGAVKLKQDEDNCIRKLHSKEGSTYQPNSRFYKHKSLSLLNGSRVPSVVLATELISNNYYSTQIRFKITRPSCGSETQMDQLELESKYRKIEETDAKKFWEQWYTYTHDHCMHGDNCSRPDCTIGKRLTVKYLICGAVLPVWNNLKNHHQRNSWPPFTKKDKEGKVIPLKVIKLEVDNGKGEVKPVVGVEAICKEQFHALKEVIRTEEPFQDQHARSENGRDKGQGKGKKKGRPRKQPKQIKLSK